MIDIPNYESYLCIDNDFNIWSKSRLISYTTSQGNIKSFYKPSRKLGVSMNSHGYAEVKTRINSQRVRIVLHRVIAQLFIPNLCNKPEVNHIDGNKMNYHPSNLEWVTSSENTIHAINTGLKVFNNTHMNRPRDNKGRFRKE